MELRFNHGLTYQFEGYAEVSEVAESLLANAKFVEEGVEVIAACWPQHDVEIQSIKLRMVSQSSPLKELIAVTLTVAFQEELAEEVPEVIENLTKLEVPEQYDGMVTVLASAVAIYSALLLWERVFGKKRKPKELDDKYRSVTNVAGDLIQVPPELIRAEIERRVGGRKKKTFAKAARDFFRPAQRHGAEEITFDAEGQRIEKRVLDEIPSDIDELDFEPLREEETFKDVLLELRAHDLDRERRGWAGVVEAVYHRRRRLVFNELVDPEVLFTKKAVRADVKVHYLEDDEGEMVPEFYEVLRVLPEGGASG